MQALDLVWRAIERSAEAAGVVVTLVSYSTKRWASATFDGARHRIMIAADPGEGFRAWAAGLGELDVRMRGHLLADLVVGEAQAMGPRDYLTIDALTVEDA